MLFCFYTISYGQITYSKDAYGNTVAKDQYGNVISTYSEDARGNTVKKDQSGNVKGTYSKNAYGNTVYMPSNANNSGISVSQYNPMSFNEIVQLRQLMNNEKNKHYYVIKVLEYYDDMWVEYKNIYDSKLLSAFLSVTETRQNLIDRYSSNNNVNESVNYATKIFNNLSKAIEEFHERKNKINAKKAQIIEYYNSLKPYLENINDGWHNVMAMDNKDFCETRKVYVTNNSIETYINGEGNSIKFNYGKIIDGKSMIELIFDNGEKDMVDIYFIEVL